MLRSEKMHIVVVPWLAFGHIIPYLDLAKHLAAKGHRISFVSGPRNLERLPKIPTNLVPLISLVPLPLPIIEDLPLGSEATTDLPFDKIPLLIQAYNGLKEPFTRFLEAASPAVDWIIHDYDLLWLRPLSDRLGVRRAMFSAVPACAFSIVTSSACQTELVGISHGLLRKVQEAKKMIDNTNGAVKGGELSMKNSDVVIIRSCLEFDGEYVQLLESLHRKPVIPLGLLPVSVVQDDGGNNNNNNNNDWYVIRAWLDKHSKGSMVYVALGSEVAPSQEQITALAQGLELSELPFLWLLRKPVGSSLELPNGFEERTRDRGLVWRSWASQPQILAHDSVGAFLTHCGASSAIEGLQFGRPLIMLPFVLDQILIAKFLQEKNVGVEISKGEKSKTITKISVAESLRLVLQDEAGKIYKEEAKKMSTMIGDQNLHGQYVDKLEEYFYKQRPLHK